MKVRTTIDLNVIMGNASPEGTGLQGYLPEGSRYEDVLFVFGEPQLGRSLDGKIQAEWVGRINGFLFTIYDYKSRLDPKRNTDWHIGGKNKFTSDLVVLYFVNRRQKTA